MNDAPREFTVGFTVIELLVAIAIIAVLAALLVPAARKVSDTSKQTECAANLRQIGIAFNSLLNDTNGTYPPYQDASRVVWYNKLAPYLGLPVDVSYRDIKPRVFQCPANTTAGWDYNKLSYGYNQYLGDNTGSGGIRVPRAAITHPAGLILCADGDSREDTYNSLLDRGWRGPGVVHHGGANILYVDGHVAWHLRDAEIAGDSWTEALYRNRGAFGWYAY